ncbi:MAG: acetyl/propionyl/methylcrotonyl-CoA carboxylase subunit alpha [Arenimonas sp.]
MFNKILIANRGEIACRIIRTCRQFGIRTVAVYSDADAKAQHVKQADEAVYIGGSIPSESYLCGDKIIEAAKQTGAQAIHPGYGFLSENADFAEAVEAAGIRFIGPKAASMRKMGSKAGAKDLMSAHGVPVVPGYTGENQDANHLLQEADRIKYPLMIKAAHGGGGKGMRIVRNHDEFLANLESCQREAKNAFGRDRVLLEKYIEQPRHIEIQVFADNFGNTIHLNERECSAQRRYQKVIEESPSPFLNSAQRKQMGDAAVQAARAIDYVNAGTVEFIVGADGDFYFMEINTRLQVEHPVTEMVTGLDLVEWQLRVAAGEKLPLEQKDIQSRGHAIEVRLYAEDPEKNFLPGSGRLEKLHLPLATKNVRLDAGVMEGDTVSIFYDPMIAKLIVWNEDRPRALAQLQTALSHADIKGPKSNIEFLEKLVRHPVVLTGKITTNYLDQHLDEVLPHAESVSEHFLMAATVTALLADEKQTRQSAMRSNDPYSPWAIADGWRIGHESQRKLCFQWREKTLEVFAKGAQGNYQVAVNEQNFSIGNATINDLTLSFQIDAQAQRFLVHADKNSITVHDGQSRANFERVPAFFFDDSKAAGIGDRITAPMPGRMVVVKAQAGDLVVEGQELAVMEAMKMELSLKSPRAGTIASINIVAGDFVEADMLLIKLEALT